MTASRDRSSGRDVFPPVPATSPAASRYEPIALSPEATLFSFTVIHPNPKFGEAPYTLVYADFPEQVRVFGRLDLPGGEPPVIGMPLRVEFVQPDAEAPASVAYRFVAAETGR